MIVAGTYLDPRRPGARRDERGPGRHAIRLEGVVGGTFDFGVDGVDATRVSEATDLTVLGHVDDDESGSRARCSVRRRTRSAARSRRTAASPATARTSMSSTRSSRWTSPPGHTLTLDGQAESDAYNVLTTAARATRAVRHQRPRHGLEPGRRPHVLRDRHERRRLPAPALHDARRGRLEPEPAGIRRPAPRRPRRTRQTSDPTGSAAVRPQEVQRINYDLGLDDPGGGVDVAGGAGDDTFAMDDNSAPTSLHRRRRERHIPVRPAVRDAAQQPAAPGGGDLALGDQFGTTATTRGWLSAGVSHATTAFGGAGDDTFQVYSNKAVLTLNGDAGNDLFIQRAFALAQTSGDCTPTRSARPARSCSGPTTRRSRCRSSP